MIPDDGDRVLNGWLLTFDLWTAPPSQFPASFVSLTTLALPSLTSMRSFRRPNSFL